MPIPFHYLDLRRIRLALKLNRISRVPLATLIKAPIRQLPGLFEAGIIRTGKTFAAAPPPSIGLFSFLFCRKFLLKDRVTRFRAALPWIKE